MAEPGHSALMASLRLTLLGILAALVLMAAPSASAIVGGAEDTEHPYVVFLGQQVQLPNGTTLNANACSGTLVAPTVVVTAAHCGLLPPPLNTFPQRWVVRQGPSIAAPTAATTGTFIAHPGFCTSCPGGPQNFGNNDLAVVLLATPLDGPYANLPKEGWVGKHFEKSKQLVVVGYGVTQPRLVPSDPVVGLGTRRFVQSRANLLAGGENFLELPMPEKDKYGVACSGDSGGANLVGDTLVAVTSIGDLRCGGPNYAFRIDTASARAFLGQYVDLR